MALARRGYADGRYGGLELKPKFGMVAGVMAAALVAGTATAADYPGTASFDGTVWSVSWAVDGAPCQSQWGPQLAGKTIELTIDGSKHLATPNLVANGPPIFLKLNAGPPNGTLTNATVDGADHLTCNGDRLLFPGYGAQPAPVPTLSEWAMILLGVVLAGGAALFIQRRRLTA